MKHTHIHYFFSTLEDIMCNESAIEAILSSGAQLTPDACIDAVIRQAGTTVLESDTSMSADEICTFVAARFRQKFPVAFTNELKIDDKARTIYFKHLLEQAIINGHDTLRNITILNELATRADLKLDSIISGLGTTHHDITTKIAAALSQLQSSHAELLQRIDQLVRHSKDEWLPRLYLPSVDDPEDYRTDFKAQMTEFTGRNEDKSQLHDFLDDNHIYRWWMITGSGGMGKSRLALQLCKEATGTYQHNGFYSLRTTDRWEQFAPQAPTLIVLDYALANLQAVTDMLKTLHNNRHSLQHKVRVLLLNREMTDEWKTIMQGHAEIRDATHGNRKQPLQLNSSEELAWKIMYNWAAKTGNEQLHHFKQGKDSILVALKKIDPQYRPLFAFFSAIAIIENEKIRSWDIGDLLDYQIKRLETKVWSHIEGYRLHKNTINKLEAINIIARGLSRDDLQEIITEDLKTVEPQKVEQIFHMVADRIHTEAGDIYTGLEPDILGEHFLLTLFTEYLQKGLESEIIKINDLCWDLFPEYTWWTYSLIHEDFICAPPIHRKDIYEQVEKILYQNASYDNLDETATVYAASLFFNITTHLHGIGIEKTKTIYLPKLFAFSERYQNNPAIALSLAKCIFNLTNRLGPLGLTETKEKWLPELFMLCTQFENNSEIALRLAKCIYNLTKRLGPGDVKEIKEKWIPELSTISNRFPTNTAITLRLAKCIVNLTNNMGPTGTKETQKIWIPLLIDLNTRFQNNAEMALRLAKCIANLIYSLGSKGQREIEKKWIPYLSTIHEQFKGNTEISFQLARAMVTITKYLGSANRAKDIREQWLPRLLKLTNEYNENAKIALAFSMGVFNLSIHSDFEDLTDVTTTWLPLLYELYRIHERNEEIALRIARCLTIIILRGKSSEDSDIENKEIQELIELHKKHPQSGPIAETAVLGIIFAIRSNDHVADAVTELYGETLLQLLETYKWHNPIAKIRDDFFNTTSNTSSS